MTHTFEAHTEDEMIEVGRQLARLLPPRAAVILTGDLGTGKTTLSKGITAERTGLDPDEVSSPTFTLIHEYGHPPRVYHIDLYRLEADAEVWGLGLDELFDRKALVLIEWGERFEKLYGVPLWRVEISATLPSPRTSPRRVTCTSPAPSPAAPSSLG
ncbi:MAG: tRNA (adenosine(37)-N6)-threonylcarbamoyltransferase complex ATPase subunit type 1 TsaE [Acidobacteria bacterium]|nr:tRNA (adenosine(37)-N6)-threonylcarbamoyltransferase complex ATPase subunit type 1 TsaE [Acidobacteriota bacterium]